MLVTCNRIATRTRGPNDLTASVRPSNDGGEPTHSIRTCTKETPTYGFLNARERLLEASAACARNSTAVSAGTDEAGHAFQLEAGRVFQSEAGHPWRQSHGSI